ncbi:MAG: adenosylcobalamin-dependent ribonucleoside-diphosphate reductase [Candidatus Nitrosocaldaceae archaeon]
MDTQLLIKKRDNTLVPFNDQKITNAIYKALLATNYGDYQLAYKLTQEVIASLKSKTEISVEDIQNEVENILIKNQLTDTAKAYILYRQERNNIREIKKKILQKNTLDEVDKKLDIDALTVLASRYLLRDENNNIIEGPKQLFERVAITITLTDILYDRRIYGISKIQHKYTYRYEEIAIGKYKLNKYHFETLRDLYNNLNEQKQMLLSFTELIEKIKNHEFDQYEENIKIYYNLMVNLDFLPNSPTLMNAGTRSRQLSACFVLDMEDDLSYIMNTISVLAMIFKSGGGVGINYSNIRPEGDIVASTSGVASGPLSFMRIVDTVTDVIKQGGKRRGANMGILESWHPDIEKFITIKTKPGILENFNISVALDKAFWDAYINNTKYKLINPRTGNTVKTIDPNQLLDLIAVSAWDSAEPGVLFLDNINKYEPLKYKLGELRATNPCGEQSLYPYESCNLGSINLSNMVKRRINGDYEFDWEKYEKTIRIATRFLDNIIDVNKYPTKEIETATKYTRRIGLGVMGLADLLFKLKIAYNSKEGYEFMNRLAEALTYYSIDESIHIAKERGPCTAYSGIEPDINILHESIKTNKIPINTNNGTFDWKHLNAKLAIYGVRNSHTTTVAPTGSISMIAGCSSGIEPLFALVFEKNITVGKFVYTNKIFEEELKKHKLYNDDLLNKIANNYGSIKGLELPFEDIFVTAMDMHWTDHIIAQAIWQKWISNAIAKTINMPNDATVEDVKSSYLLAYALGLKGITVYRDGSRNQQVLNVVAKNKNYQIQPSEYAVQYIKDNVNNVFLKDIEKSFKLMYSNNTPKIQKCHICNNPLVNIEGCKCCYRCGLSYCASS